MRRSRAGEAAFVGRARLLAQIRQSLDSGIPVFLKGESGVGKTALAHRAAPKAFYIEHCSPVKELLTSLLVALYHDGLHDLEDDGKGDDDTAPDEEELRRKFKRLDTRAALAAICSALKTAAVEAGAPPIIIFDEFETVTATTIRAVRQISGHATLICCAPGAKPAQKPFLVAFTQIEVPRLTHNENEKLIGKLLDDHADDISAKERPRLTRQIAEQSQGLPRITRELVKRVAARGELSTDAVRREDLHGAKPLDMTPGLVVGAILIAGMRVAMRPLHDADMMVLFGFSGAILMIVRLFFFSINGRGRRG